MPEYRIRETGEIVADLKAQFPNSSLPLVLTQDDFDILGIDPVFEGPQGSTTSPYEYSYRDGVEEINGKWYTKYVTGPVFQEYTDADNVIHTAEEQELEYKTRIDNQQWESIRNQRNALLTQSDWTQFNDSPLSPEKQQEWVEYRQALRDITLQEDPFNIVWPIKPS